jgi:hypothetical protein
MNPAFVAILSRGRGGATPLSGQKRVWQDSRKFTYEFRPPAEPECRHEPNCWSPVTANPTGEKEDTDDEDETWGDDEKDEDNDE